MTTGDSKHMNSDEGVTYNEKITVPLRKV